ncbi:MAG: hypothetical protein ABFD00_05080 [Chloroherpetonaceae bacterium]
MRKLTLNAHPFLLLRGTIRGGSFLAMIIRKYFSISSLIFSSEITY